MKHLIATFAGCALCTVVAARPFDVPLDAGQSTLSAELCISGKCDTDTSALTGTITIELDSVEAPALIWLHDFNLEFVNDVAWHLSWGILGRFDATASDVSIRYVTTNGILGPEPVLAGEYVFYAVPAKPEGMLDYTATGVPCLALIASGLPCSDTQDLGAGAFDVTASELGGMVTSQDRTVSLSVEGLDVTIILDPANPDLGTLRVFGFAYGEVYVPGPGDFDGDGDVDLDDYMVFADCMDGPDVPPDPALPGVTAEACIRAFAVDPDDDVDAADFAGFQAAFTGG